MPSSTNTLYISSKLCVGSRLERPVHRPCGRPALPSSLYALRAPRSLVRRRLHSQG
eukprot:CAMPEP_0204080610 /NCGR_PEP_ID=MMETSP0360-20130528/174275_1 /ASSEMBLY_ACC=CAM_ASM_000342 /TAXON_ID=268821 /ORGANISM="Scrippsiella Hangoei, Strain SHTV-5" /LENGTH=55 /DNA_ID=CAMNT_0051029403 /DNA_START=20 /DNA_END=187 /DNA_ORIENTATION=-